MKRVDKKGRKKKTFRDTFRKCQLYNLFFHFAVFLKCEAGGDGWCEFITCLLAFFSLFPL